MSCHVTAQSGETTETLDLSKWSNTSEVDNDLLLTLYSIGISASLQLADIYFKVVLGM